MNIKIGWNRRKIMIIGIINGMDDRQRIYYLIDYEKLKDFVL